MADQPNTPSTETPTPAANDGGEPDVNALIAEAVAEAEKGDQAEAETPKPEVVDPAKPAEAEKPPAPAAETPDQALDRARKALRGAAKREAKALQREQAASALIEKAKLIDELGTAPFAALAKALGGADKVAPWLDKVIAEGEQAKPPSADDRVAAIEKRMEAERAARAEQENTVALQAARKQVADAVAAAGEKFDLINSTGQHDLVWQTMERVYARDGVAPDPMEIAAAVEKHLEEVLIEKAAKSKKFAARVGAIKPTPASSGNQPPKPSPGAVTLDNRDTPAVPSGDDELPLDPYEREKALRKQLGF